MTDLKEIRDGRKLNIINYISRREDDKRKRERDSSSISHFVTIIAKMEDPHVW